MSYYVTSFISILHFISDDLIQVDSTTRILTRVRSRSNVCSHCIRARSSPRTTLALCCFEATHKVPFMDKLWETDAEEYDEMTIEEFIEAYVDPREQRDPLFVTKRFLMYQESLTRALTEEGEEGEEEPPF